MSRDTFLDFFFFLILVWSLRQFSNNKLKNKGKSRQLANKKLPSRDFMSIFNSLLRATLFGVNLFYTFFWGSKKESLQILLSPLASLDEGGIKCGSGLNRANVGNKIQVISLCSIIHSYCDDVATAPSIVLHSPFYHRFFSYT